jgi:formylglycine-generating enzyme required for sulfatase activity
VARARLSVFGVHAALMLTCVEAKAQDCSACPTLVPIPAGSFVMGSPDDEPERESWQAGTESPAHRVSFQQAFGMAATAVTVGQFRQFVRSSGHKTDGGCHLFDGTDWRLAGAASWQAPGFIQTDDHPAVCLSWHDASAYVAWLNTTVPAGARPFRLPTEAEREYATRAGTTTPFWWGRTISPKDASYDTREVYAGGQARAPYAGSTVSVRAFAANPWGLYGVHGGVWEWTADCYSATHAGKPEALLQSGSIPRSDVGCDRRVLRGGAFNRHPRTLRAAYRTGLDPNFRGHSIGFRIAR